jgi:hypothetical protein
MPIFSCFTVFAVATALPWTPPSPVERAESAPFLAEQEARFNPAEAMIRRPFSTPGYHTELTGGFVHPTRGSLLYALMLLDTGEPDHLARALSILDRVVALQDTDPSSRTFGIWSWYLEEPLARMAKPDFNWADFNGVTLLQVARDHRSRIPTDLMRRIEQAILNACAAIQKRDVKPGYTNIALMGSYVTLYAGELLDHEGYRAYGMSRLRRVAAEVANNGGFEEYNSPTYTLVALEELARMQAHVTSPEAQTLIAPLLRQAWEDIAEHFHAPTRQWAGPYSRVYSSLLRPAALGTIQRSLSGVDFGIAINPLDSRRLPLRCPDDLQPHFLELPTPRTVTQQFVRRSETIGTTYLHPEYALGSINRGDLWNQRRALLLHWGTPERPGYLQLRLLKDGYDFASGYLESAQIAGRVLGAVTLVTDGGDTHISLNRVRDGTITTSDLRLRFELGGPAAQTAIVALHPNGHQARLTLGKVQATLVLAYARFAHASPKLEVGEGPDLRWIDLVLHAGSQQTIDLRSLEEAVVGFALAIGEETAPKGVRAAGLLQLTDSDLSVSVPIRPQPRRFDESVHTPLQTVTSAR